MIKKLLVFLVFLNSSFVYAQTIKTDVLVIGGSVSGTAAAIQCAHSKVKTILIEQGPALVPDMKGDAMVAITTNRNLPSGIWGEFRKRVIDFYKKVPGYDTAYNAPLKFEPFTGAAILKKMADTVKNLTIKLNTPFTAIKKDGSGWEVSVTINNKTALIKAKVVIDATATGAVAQKAGAAFNEVFTGTPDIYASNLYRTSIAAGDGLPGETSAPYCIPINTVVINNLDNLLITEKALPPSRDIQRLPVQLALGQGAGVVAAYCAFFKTTTKNLKVRVIQGELLDFKGFLLPLGDISATDPYIRAMQQVCATGLLKGVQKTSGGNTQLFFMPDSTVSTAEIKPVLLEIYTRAFLWFNNSRLPEKFTVGNLLSFISDYTLSDPKTLQLNLQKAWKTQYKFTADFDMNRPVTRREFAILANKYLNPFARMVDLHGRMVN